MILKRQAACVLVCATIFAVCSLHPGETRAASLTSNAIARFGSGNTTYGESEVTGFALPPDGTTGVQEAGNTHLTTLAEGVSNLSHNSIGGASGWIGGSVIDAPQGNGGTIWNLNAGSLTRIDDTILVTSPTLPDGTPVQLLFSLHAVTGTQAVHSRIPGSFNDNHAFVNSSISGVVRDQNQSVNSVFIDAADHQIIRNTNDFSDDKNVGILNPNTPQLDIVLNTEVGHMIQFLVSINTNSFGKLSPYPVNLSPLEIENATGSVLSAIGLAFGGTSLTDDVVLQSELYGGEFPAAALANGANAAMGMPTLPIPEPSTLSVVLLTMAGAVHRTRR